MKPPPAPQQNIATIIPPPSNNNTTLPNNNTNDKKVSTYGICFHCSKIGDNLKCCSGCRAAWYCCVEHQKLDYPKHKSECRALRKLRKKQKKKKLTVDTCNKLIIHCIDEITKIQDMKNLMEASKVEITEYLKQIEKLRASFLEIVTWDQHIKCLNHIEIDELLFVTSYRFCLLKHSDVYQTFYSMEKNNACVEVVNRNYLRGAMYEKFWFEKSGFASNNEEVIEDISLFHAEKEKLLGEISLLQQGGADAAYYHYLAACKINDQINQQLLLLSSSTMQEKDNNDGSSINNDKTKYEFKRKLWSTRKVYYNMKDATNNGAILRKMMHCMARQENYEGADAIYEQAVKAFDELEEEEVVIGDKGNRIGGKEGKLAALRFERAAMYQFGAMQIMQNANDLLKSGKKKDMAEYKETLEVMQQEMIELIQKSAKEFIFIIADAMEREDKEMWSKAIGELAKTYLMIPGTAGKKKADHYAKEVLKAHCCGDKCIDTILCKQILAVNHPRKIDMHKIFRGIKPSEEMCKIKMVNVFPDV